MSKTLKKLLASALAATMLFSTAVTALVASAATTVDVAITVDAIEVACDATTDPIEVPVKMVITETDDAEATGTLAPHVMFDIEGATVDAQATTALYASGGKYFDLAWYIEYDADTTESKSVIVESSVSDEIPYKEVTAYIIVNLDENAEAVTVVDGSVQATNVDEYDLGTVTLNNNGNIALTHTAADAVVENEVPADCDTAGSYDSVVKCSDCEEEISRETVTVDALGHAYGTPVDNGDGTHTATCANDAAHTETAGHTYEDGTCACGAVEVVACEHTDANQDGICDACDYENLDESLAFFGKGIVLGADIRGVLQVRKYKSTSPYESFKVIAEKEGVESELELVATSDKTSYTTYGYAITVAPKEMVDIIKARIVGITAEGEAFISNIETWSIKQGFIELMDTYSTQTTDSALNRMKLCANTLNYGAEAQKNFNYKVDDLATDGLSAEYAAYIITETPEMEEIPATDDTGATAPLTQIGFNLAAKVQILPCFKVDKTDVKEDYSAEITQVHTAPDGTVTTEEYTIDGADCLKSNTTFGVYIQNLESNDLRDVLTVTLYKNGEVVSATHTFSAESVAKGKFDTNPTLYSALMVYGDCARACFG